MGVVVPLPQVRLVSPPAPPQPPRAFGARSSGTALPQTGGRRRQYRIGDLQHLLAFPESWIARTVIAKLRALAVTGGLPLPVTPRIVNGREITGPDAICLDSAWDAGEIDAWAAHRRGDTDLTCPAPLPPAIREDMARRAAAIGMGARA